MPDEPRRGVDPWRVAIDLSRQAQRAAAERPRLAAALDAHARRFGPRSTSTAAVLDEVEARSIIDVDAPVASSRPLVPALKRAARKANAFLARHLASQVTVLVGGLAVAARDLDRRIARLEHEHDADAAAPFAPDMVEPFAEVLAGRPAAGVRRDVRTLAEARLLPPADAAAVVVSQIPDVAGPGVRRELLGRVVPGLAPGGWLAIIGTMPSAWATVASELARDMAPGRPVHPETWTHLLGTHGPHQVEVHRTADAYAVIAAW